MFSTTMREKRLKTMIKAIKWPLILVIVAVFGLLLIKAPVLATATSTTWNFYSYPSGSFDLNSIGWSKLGTDTFSIRDILGLKNLDRARTNVDIVFVGYLATSSEAELINDSPISISGTVSLDRVGTLYSPRYVIGLAGSLTNNMDDYACYFYNISNGSADWTITISASSTTYNLYNNNLSEGTYPFSIIWYPETELCDYDFNGTATTTYQSSAFDIGTISNFGISMFDDTYVLGSWRADTGLSTLTYSYNMAPLRVWGISPANGSTITDTNQSLTFGWQGFDFDDIYTDFLFQFYEPNTGIVSGSTIYTPATTFGTAVVNISDIEIDKNATYYLRVKARSPLYNGSAFYTEDLVSPEYYLIVEVSGWETLFFMPDYGAWYNTHVDKYATPTPVFAGVVGFLSPLFGTIGEFGAQVSALLNSQEAYQRGYDFGTFIPLFSQYVDLIAVFFGGFHIIGIFSGILLVMLGIFAFKTIMKFWP